MTTPDSSSPEALFETEASAGMTAAVGTTKAMPRPLALSASRINDYKRCPLQYRLRAIDRIPEPSTWAQVKGTLVHAVLEEMFSWPRPQRLYPAAVKQLKPSWAQLCEKNPEYAEVVAEEKFLEFLVECRELLKNYFLMENPMGFDPAACEQYVNKVLDNGVPVRGFMDRVDINDSGLVRVVDYKTGKMPKPWFSQDADFQMLFYGLLYWRTRGVIPAQLRLIYLKEQGNKVLSPSATQLEYLEKDLADLWEKMRSDGMSGDFRPKENKLCPWCPFHNYCPAQGGVPPEYPGWPGALGEAKN